MTLLHSEEFKTWYKRWMKRLERQEQSKERVV